MIRILRILIPLKSFCPETEEILREPNAGAASKHSEALAMEILSREFGAQGIFTEMEIEYFNGHWKKCDFVTSLRKHKIGVSVTRVLPIDWNPEQWELYIARLLHKKLFGLVVSRCGTVGKYVFERSILFVWCPNLLLARLVWLTFHHLVDPVLKDDVELVLAEASWESLQKDFPFLSS